MFENGLLVVTTAILRSSNNALSAVLQSCASSVRQLLYVHLVSTSRTTIGGTAADKGLAVFGRVPCTGSVRRFITNFYVGMTNVRQSLEVRFLLNNVHGASAPLPSPAPHTLQHRYDVILTDTGQELHSSLVDHVRTHFLVENSVPVVHLDVEDMDHQAGTAEESVADVTTYQSVCLGGTFDRMHVGHHILLTEGCLLADRSLTVGVTDGQMNSDKLLCELMQTTDERLQTVHQFVSDIKPALHYNIVPITDPFGPAITDPALECIVVSSETVRGAAAVNRRRDEKGMKPLAVEVIELVPDAQHSADEEEKISSSSQRKRLLGTLIRPPLKAPSKPYVVGLTGSTASGKSSVCGRLERLGAGVIDCDKLGHKSYEPGTDTHQRLVSEFGADILSDDGQIDRRRLAGRVFSSKDELDKLNAIVWPAIQRLCQQEIDKMAAAGRDVVVLDAAVLLEAGWDNMVHEVWTTVIPKKEAVRRLVERNRLAEEEAERRVAAQMSGEQRVSRANVVLCTLWHTDVTQKQVAKAWKLLQDRLLPTKS